MQSGAICSYLTEACGATLDPSKYTIFSALNCKMMCVQHIRRGHNTKVQSRPYQKPLAVFLLNENKFLLPIDNIYMFLKMFLWFSMCHSAVMWILWKDFYISNFFHSMRTGTREVYSALLFFCDNGWMDG